MSELSDLFTVMRITFKQLKVLPVITESGTNLGRVVDLEIDANNHGIGKYIVSAWPAILKRDKLLIAPEQVISVDTKKVLVKDGTIKVAEVKPIFAAQSVKEAAAVNAEMRD